MYKRTSLLWLNPCGRITDIRFGGCNLSLYSCFFRRDVPLARRRKQEKGTPFA